jgi:hypothetical protein
MATVIFKHFRYHSLIREKAAINGWVRSQNMQLHTDSLKVSTGSGRGDQISLKKAQPTLVKF